MELTDSIQKAFALVEALEKQLEETKEKEKKVQKLLVENESNEAILTQKKQELDKREAEIKKIEDLEKYEKDLHQKEIEIKEQLEMLNRRTEEVQKKWAEINTYEEKLRKELAEKEEMHCKEVRAFIENRKQFEQEKALYQARILDSIAQEIKKK